MKKIWIIAKRELNAFFDSLMAYIVIILFLGLTGFFTWLFGNDIFIRNVASLDVFFGWASIFLFIIIPALTMGLLAEENKTNTIEMLLTKPVNDWEVIVGKFLSTLILVLICLLLTVPYYITVANIGPIDHGSVLTGYLGLILMGASFTSIGLFASSITNNQIIAFLIAIILGLLFYFIFGLISLISTGVIGKVFHYLDLRTHFDSISRGVIDLKDLIYFLSLIIVGLFISETNLAKRNIVH